MLNKIILGGAQLGMSYRINNMVHLTKMKCLKYWILQLKMNQITSVKLKRYVWVEGGENLKIEKKLNPKKIKLNFNW